jgi:hypothetical protein
MKLLDDNVLIKIVITDTKTSKIILPESVKESDAVDKKFVVEDVGPDVEPELVGKKVWLDTFGPKFGSDREHFLVKRESIYAYDD